MSQKNFHIIGCQSCGSKNRVPADRGVEQAKCGRCGQALKKTEHKESDFSAYNFRCLNCGAKNRIPAGKVDAKPNCGKCKNPLKTEELFIPQPIMVTDSNFDSQVLKSPLPVLLFAWASWCPTCGTYTPVIDEFASEAKGKIRVGKINVDANPMLASRFNILSVPYLFIFDNGQMKENMPGGIPKHELLMKMAHYF